MFHGLIHLAAVAGLVAGASAQQQMPAASLHPVSNLQFGSFDFENGFTATTNGNRVYGPDILFSTVANFAYYWTTPGGGTLQEWLDEAQLPNRGLTQLEQVTGMSWAYCEGLGVGYFDATVRLYNDTNACVGPSTWTPGAHSFATCEYLITGLPGGGLCWQVGIDLSCGNECVLPDGTNPLSGAQGTIGWSVTASAAGYYSGPILLKAADANATPGSQDLFEWHDRNGSYFGTGAYYNAGCYFFGGNPHASANFFVEFAGSPVDVQNCYNSRPKDTLCLEALSNPVSGAPLSFSVTDLGGSGSARATMMFEKDQAITGVPGCEQIKMGPGAGLFTRQVGFPPLYAPPKAILVSSAPQGYTVPALAAGTRCVLQVVGWSGASGYTIGQVVAVSNGLDVRL